MLTKEQKASKVKTKLLSMSFNRTEVTSLSKEEVLKIYAETKLRYKLVVWGNSSATYYKYEYN